MRHLNKNDGPHALYRGGGSIGFVAACRLAWIVGRDPRNDERLVLAQTKNNYAPMQPSLAYQLAKDGPRIDWQGPSLWVADELAVRQPKSARHRAREFLRQFLEAGPRTTREIWAATREHAFSKDTLRRAGKEMGYTPVRVDRDGQRLHYWLLKGQEVPGLPVSETPGLDAWMENWRKLYPPATPLDEEK